MTRKGFIYTPAKTRQYEAHGRLAAQEAMVDRTPLCVPVRAEITVDLPVPASWSLKRQAAALAGYIRPTSRPDTDNPRSTRSTALSSLTIASSSSSPPRRSTRASRS